MIPREVRTGIAFAELNANRKTVEMLVVNTDDRPIQVESHYHFFEVNRALVFDREGAFGKRLCIPPGSAVRFEPGEEKPVQLVEIAGARRAYGLHGLTDGMGHNGRIPDYLRRRWKDWEGKQP